MQQGVNVFLLPQKNNLSDLSDRFVFLFGADTANTVGSVAQTATISAVNLFQNSNLIIAGNTISAQSITTNTVTSNTLVANVYNNILGYPAFTVNFSFTAAQIANLAANSITLVPSQGANTFIMPVNILAYMSIGTPWTLGTGIAGFWLGNTNVGSVGNAVDDNVFQYTITGNNAIGFSAGSYVFSNTIGNMMNHPLVLTSNGSSPTGGNTSMTGVLQYIVLPNLP